ncbi:hypothetical protein I6E29_07225 [Arcanobacterium haemolyticum]|nr:hypothetical protein [Arcanobacterium haemolyticum]
MTGRHWDAHRVQSFAYQSAQDAAKTVVKDANNLMETWYASRRERAQQTE